MSEWKYFSRAELACRCCGVERMDLEFMRKLEALREAAGFPFVPTSAYRCPAHNVSVSSSGPNGPHTTGRAIDIAVRGERAHWLLSNAARFGFTGLGVHQKGSGRRFIHLDDLPGPQFPRPNVWSY